MIAVILQPSQKYGKLDIALSSDNRIWHYPVTADLEFGMLEVFKRLQIKKTQNLSIFGMINDPSINLLLYFVVPR